MVNSARGVVPRPSSKFKSSLGTVDKNGIQDGDTISGVAMGPVIPVSEKRTASMPVTPFLESSLGSPGPSSMHKVPSNASIVSEVILTSVSTVEVRAAVHWEPAPSDLEV